MKRALIALVPVIGLSAFVITGQSCASKTLLEEVKEETKEPKQNIAQAKENLKEAKNILSEVRNILNNAKAKLEEKQRMRETVVETPAPQMQAEEEKPAYATVKVRWCDTLWDISDRVYGNSLYWPAIYNLNKGKIGEDPWILSQGMELTYKVDLSEEEKNQAVKEAIEWSLRFKDRKLSPKCPPK